MLVLRPCSRTVTPQHHFFVSQPVVCARADSKCFLVMTVYQTIEERSVVAPQMPCSTVQLFSAAGDATQGTASNEEIPSTPAAYDSFRIISKKALADYKRAERLFLDFLANANVWSQDEVRAWCPPDATASCAPETFNTMIYIYIHMLDDTVVEFVMVCQRPFGAGERSCR